MGDIRDKLEQCQHTGCKGEAFPEPDGSGKVLCDKHNPRIIEWRRRVLLREAVRNRLEAEADKIMDRIPESEWGSLFVHIYPNN